MNVTQQDLPIQGARTLAWVNDALIDVAAGWQQLYPELRPPRFIRYGPRFDATCAAPAGDVVALIDSLGTKALLLESDGQVIREINRSYYHANVYRYPIALFTLPGGRTGLAHCPDDYNLLQLEDAHTGERLTATEGRKPADLFHSRLAVSDDGSMLLSAGWVWHPWDVLAVYDLSRALSQSDELDGLGSVLGIRGLANAEVSGACFVGADVIVSTGSEENDPDSPDGLEPQLLARWSTFEGRFTWRHQLDHCAGDLVSLAGNVLALNQHPRLYDADSGLLLHQWPDLPTGESTSSITRGDTFAGPRRIAIDPHHPRFAYTDGTRVVIVEVA